MTRYTLLIILAFSVYTLSYGQDDDVYFVPQKKTDVDKKVKFVEESAQGVDEEECYNWTYPYYAKSFNDSTCYDNYENLAQGTCTDRIIRFHSPNGIYVSSPYYSQYIDIWTDPWYFYHTGNIYWPMDYWLTNYWWDLYPSFHWAGMSPFWGPFYHYYHHYPYYPILPPYYPYPGTKPNVPHGKTGPHGGYLVYGSGGKRQEGGRPSTGNVRNNPVYGNRNHQREYNRNVNRNNYQPHTSNPSRNFGNI